MASPVGRWMGLPWVAGKEVLLIFSWSGAILSWLNLSGVEEGGTWFGWCWGSRDKGEGLGPCIFTNRVAIHQKPACVVSFCPSKSFLIGDSLPQLFQPPSICDKCAWFKNLLLFVFTSFFFFFSFSRSAVKSLASSTATLKAHLNATFIVMCLCEDWFKFLNVKIF